MGRFHCILSKMLCNRVRDGTLGRSLPVLEVTECSGKKKPCISKLRKIFKTFNVTQQKENRNISQGADTDTGLLFINALALLCRSLSQYCTQV